MANTIYNPPVFTWKSLYDFPLSKLEKTFSIADFERELKTRHVNSIVKSMVQNRFYDNVFRVTQRPTGQYEVIDGQHRLEALGKLRDIYNITRYDIVLQIFAPDDAREIYRRLNWSRPLQMRDHLKALDNGKNAFFVQLRPYYDHYGKGKLLRYEMMLNALHYAKNGSPRAVRSMLVEQTVAKVTAGDIESIKNFTKAIRATDGNMHSKSYRAVFFRNAFRVGYENNFDKDMWGQFIRFCMADKVINELCQKRTYEVTKRVYSYMVVQVGEHLGWDLKRIDRAMSQAKLVVDKGPIFR